MDRIPESQSVDVFRVGGSKKEAFSAPNVPFAIGAAQRRADVHGRRRSQVGLEERSQRLRTRTVGILIRLTGPMPKILFGMENSTCIFGRIRTMEDPVGRSFRVPLGGYETVKLILILYSTGSLVRTGALTLSANGSVYLCTA